MPLVLFLGICLDFYYYLRRVLLPKIGLHFDRGGCVHWCGVSVTRGKPRAGSDGCR
nr:hypothetical protein HMPREF0276_0378 [Corynebacterium accolens ATCC 49725]